MATTKDEVLSKLRVGISSKKISAVVEEIDTLLSNKGWLISALRKVEGRWQLTINISATFNTYEEIHLISVYRKHGWDDIRIDAEGLNSKIVFYL